MDYEFHGPPVDRRYVPVSRGAPGLPEEEARPFPPSSLNHTSRLGFFFLLPSHQHLVSLFLLVLVSSFFSLLFFLFFSTPHHRHHRHSSPVFGLTQPFVCTTPKQLEPYPFLSAVASPRKKPPQKPFERLRSCTFPHLLYSSPVIVWL